MRPRDFNAFPALGALGLRCEKCGAKPREGCKTSTGRRCTRTHEAREWASLRAARAAVAPKRDRRRPYIGGCQGDEPFVAPGPEKVSAPNLSQESPAIADPACTHPLATTGTRAGCKVCMCLACGLTELLEPMPLILCCNKPPPGCGWCWYCRERTPLETPPKKRTRK